MFLVQVFLVLPGFRLAPEWRPSLARHSGQGHRPRPGIQYFVMHSVGSGHCLL